jgi:hypothetical protein
VDTKLKYADLCYILVCRTILNFTTYGGRDRIFVCKMFNIAVIELNKVLSYCQIIISQTNTIAVDSQSKCANLLVLLVQNYFEYYKTYGVSGHIFACKMLNISVIE